MSDNIGDVMQAVNKVSIIDQVVDSIRDSITKGDLAIGSRLPSELSLCDTLSVSRSTIREAFKVLQTMGYVELRRGKGAYVRDNDPHDLDTIRSWFKASAPKLEDFTEVRGALETLAIRMAIERCQEEDVVKLEQTNFAFIRAVGEHNVSELARLDELFHSQIVAMTRNSLLINLNGIVATEFRKYRVMSFTVKANAESAMVPHLKILEAIKKRDTAEGVLQVNNHLHLVIVDMKAIIGE